MLYICTVYCRLETFVEDPDLKDPHNFAGSGSDIFSKDQDRLQSSLKNVKNKKVGLNK